MKQYLLKKKQEYDERLNKVKLEYRGAFKLYDVIDINNILLRYMNILIEICNRNKSLIDVDAINNDINNSFGDIYKISIIQQDAVNEQALN